MTFQVEITGFLYVLILAPLNWSEEPSVRLLILRHVAVSRISFHSYINPQQNWLSHSKVWLSATKWRPGSHLDSWIWMIICALAFYTNGFCICNIIHVMLLSVQKDVSVVYVIWLIFYPHQSNKSSDCSISLTKKKKRYELDAIHIGPILCLFRMKRPHVLYPLVQWWCHLLLGSMEFKPFSL